ncbi:MAG: tRNA epoxyqueuosine(34) reductase QueG [Bacteroidales bacterium]|nr:tRNA epoxyqueuosine(34) reductase QueG [Bacteroidales bacterium]
MPTNRQELYSSLIKKEAINNGYSACGFSKVCFLDEEAPRLESWLKRNGHAGMTYMERNFNLRLNPALLVEDSETIITLLYQYGNVADQNIESYYKVAQFARLFDYHVFLKEKMKLMIESLKIEIGDFNARTFVDSAPILERAWAVRSGLGFVGKNSQLIIPNLGASFFICQIITDLKPVYDNKLNLDLCGRCRKCIDACPNKAILEDKTIDASRCISYLTIEDKEENQNQTEYGIENRIFGCDICLEVCPLNQCKKNNQDAQNYVNKPLLALNKKNWEILNDLNFKENFKNTPFWRTGLKKIKKNIEKANSWSI